MKPLQTGDPSRIGSYRLLGRLGEGGMGRVFLGTSLGGRRVAVKVIRPGLTDDPQFRTRFAREVEAARMVNSFYTAPVVDADPEGDPPWMVTAYIPGPSLHSLVADHGPLPEYALRGLGAGLAEGLLSVHAAGLVHRDLKPANVIMAEDGPRIIDFGIARAVDASALTAHGTIMGTFTYMSPEQVRGEPAGPQSDVFSLACVLVFAAIGHSPFEAPTLPAIVHRVLNTEPDLTGVPPSVRALLVHCLAKDPASRPPTAEVLDELTQLAPTRKAPIPPTTPVTSPQSAVRERAPRDVTPEHHHVLAAPRIGRRSLLIGGATGAAALIAGGWLVLRKSDAGGQALKGQAPSAEFMISSDLWGRYAADAVAFSPDGKTLASSHRDGTIRVWDTSTGKSIHTLSGVSGSSVAFSPDGKSLACASAASGKGKISIWDPNTGTLMRTLGASKDDSVSTVLYGNAQTLVSLTGSGRVDFWDDLGKKKTIPNTGSAGGWGRAGAISPKGDLLALGGEGPLGLWSMSTGKSTLSLKGHTEPVNGVAFSPDGRSLVSGGDGGKILLWDLASKTHADLTESTDDITNVAFAPDGTFIAAAYASNDSRGRVQTWDATTLRKTGPLTLPRRDNITDMVISPDAKTVAGAGLTGIISLWKIY